MLHRYRLLLWISVVVLVLDQTSKMAITRSMLLHQSRTLIDNVLNLCYVLNPGAAFGILADSSLRIPLLSGVAVLATVAILWVYRHLKAQQLLQRIGLALVFSGALGNLIDRLRLGAVIDFIDVHWYQYHWPAFNIADSAITIGVGVLLIDLWREERRRRHK